MTIIMMREKSADGKREATAEWDKSGIYQAFVYEKYGSDWHITHRSQPTIFDTKTIAAYKRFVNRYIKER